MGFFRESWVRIMCKKNPRERGKKDIGDIEEELKIIGGLMDSFKNKRDKRERERGWESVFR